MSRLQILGAVCMVVGLALFIVGYPKGETTSAVTPMRPAYLDGLGDGELRMMASYAYMRQQRDGADEATMLLAIATVTAHPDARELVERFVGKERLDNRLSNKAVPQPIDYVGNLRRDMERAGIKR